MIEQEIKTKLLELITNYDQADWLEIAGVIFQESAELLISLESSSDIMKKYIDYLVDEQKS